MWWPLAAAEAARPFLPLESLRYDVDVTGPIARIEVVETFRNTTDGLVDAVYVFPLAPGAAIDHLHIRVGTREIEGVVQGRAEARAAYDAARDEGRTAALTEAVRGDVFTQDVANLPPGEAVVVTFSVVQPVGRAGDHWALTLPLLAPPRFLPLGSAPVLAALSAGSSRDVGVRADVELTVQAGAGVRDLWAAPLPRDVRPDLFGSAARLRLDDLPLDADLSIGWRTARDRPTAALLVSDTHVLVLAEDGLREPLDGAGVAFGACAVADVVSLPGPGAVVLARRVGACPGPVAVGTARVWPRRAVDAHTLGSAWARARVEVLDAQGAADGVRALGLEYGLVTSQTSLVAVDSGGPVHAAPRGGADRWDASGFDRDADGLVDELDVWDGKRERKEREKRAPANKPVLAPVRQEEYGQLGAPPVDHAQSRSEEVLVVEGVPTALPGVAERAAPLPGTSPLRALRHPAPDLSSDAATGELGVGAPWPTAALPGWRVDGTVAGAVVPSRLRAVADVDLAHVAATFPVDTRSLGAELATVRGPQRGGLAARFSDGVSADLVYGAVSGDATLAGQGWRLGGAARALRLGAESAETLTAAASAEARSGPFVAALGLDGGRWAQRGGGEVDRWLATGWSSVRWTRRAWDASAALSGEQVGGVTALAPRLAVSVGSGARFGLSGGRRVDPGRTGPDGVVPSAWDLAVDVGGGDRLAAWLTASVVRDRAVLVLPSALDPLPDPGPVAERTVPVLSAALDRPGGGPWLLSARFDWRPRPALLVAGDDPRAAFAPGWVAASRPWAFDGRVGVRWPRTSSASLRWTREAAADPDGPWWVRARSTLAADLDQGVGLAAPWEAHLRLSLAWTRNDPDQLPVPAEVMVAAPVDPGAWSPWRLAGALAVTF